MPDNKKSEVWQDIETAPTDGSWIYVSGLDYENRLTYYTGAGWWQVEDAWLVWRPCSSLPQLNLGSTRHRASGIWMAYSGDRGGLELSASPDGATLEVGIASEIITGTIKLTPQQMVQMNNWISQRIAEMLLDSVDGPPAW